MMGAEQVQPPTPPLTPPGVGIGYVSMVASAMGIASSLTPDEVAHLATLNSRGEVNKKLIEKAEARSTVSIPPGVQEMINAVVPSNTAYEISNLQRSIEEDMGSAERYTAFVMEYLTQAAKNRIKIMALEGSQLGLLPEVQEILATKWYTLDEGRTMGEGEGKVLYFITEPVYIRHVNPDAGINKTVSMGRYTIAYNPSEAQILVLPHSHNREVDGYIHPHVSSNSLVCWGTGMSTVAEALASFRPSVAFGVLRSLLQTYNDAGPYKQLECFESVRTKEELEHLGYEYKVARADFVEAVQLHGWVWRVDIPPGVRKEGLTKRKRTLSGAGYPGTMTQYLVGPLYYKYYTATDVKATEECFIKTTSGEFVAIRVVVTQHVREQA